MDGEVVPQPQGPAKIKLKRPLKVGNGEVVEIKLDLESLTGADIDMCISETIATKHNAVVLCEFDTEFHAQVAAKLSGIDRALFRSMDGGDYVRLLGPIRAFFLGSD
jgi:hypothetical protein